MVAVHGGKPKWTDPPRIEHPDRSGGEQPSKPAGAISVSQFEAELNGPEPGQATDEEEVNK